MLIDTHCHLDFHEFDKDREQVLRRAREVDLVRILNPGIDLPSSRSAIKLAEMHPEVFAAVGVHPNSALEWTERTHAELSILADHSKVVAIGEIGLDYYRDHAPPAVQKEVLLNQLELAKEKKLPIVLHCRQAFSDLLDIIAEWRKGFTPLDLDNKSLIGVLHSFSDELHTANRALTLGLAIGITGPVTFRNAESLQSVVSKLPLDKVVIETDSPFLSPHPKRGQRNEPSYACYIADKIADLKRLPVDLVAEVTTNTANQLFTWRENF